MNSVKRLLVLTVLGTLLCGGACAMGAQQQDAEAGDGRDAREMVKLPGVTIDVAHRRVDIEAKVCLDEGLLELIACTPDTKEHESLVVTDAAPVHVHAALLLIGAENGTPATAEPIDEAKTRWVHLPPSGDRLRVSLVYPGEDGKPVDRPISHFIRRTDEDRADTPPDAAQVFETFLFAGSRVFNDEQGNRHYLADESGHLVSISTFGDEVVCLPVVQTRDNAGLVWQANGEALPKVGTKVTLRLTLAKPAESDKQNKPENEGEPE